MASNTLEVTCGESDRIRLDMSRINAAEHRIGEVRAVTNISIASDLKATFNEAWSDCTRHLALLESRLLFIERKLRLAKAEAVLDKYPAFLSSWIKKNADLKLKDNQDIRDSFVYRDAEFQKWQGIKDHVKAVVALIESKAQSLERAYWDCKQNLEEQARLRSQQPMNSGGIADDEVFQASPQVDALFGTSKY